MTMRPRVFGVDGSGERLDRGQVGVGQLPDQDGRITIQGEHRLLRAGDATFAGPFGRVGGLVGRVEESLGGAGVQV